MWTAIGPAWSGSLAQPVMRPWVATSTLPVGAASPPTQPPAWQVVPAGQAPHEPPHPSPPQALPPQSGWQVAGTVTVFGEPSQAGFPSPSRSMAYAMTWWSPGANVVMSKGMVKPWLPVSPKAAFTSGRNPLVTPFVANSPST